MRLRRAVLSLLALAGAAAPLLVFAAQSSPSAPESIRQTLESRFPGISIIDVKPSPLPGLYEVFTGDTIVYADSTGDRMLVGSLMDTANQKDLTAERIHERNSIEFESLPFEQAIKVVKGTGKRRLAVFADPDCPFCRRLESELGALDDVTVYTFLFPIQELHADAVARSRAIWCSPDRAKAWSQWLLEKKATEGPASCGADPVEELQALGRKLHITGTPTLFLANGRRVAGALTAAELNDLLDSSAVAVRQSGKQVAE
jgi:thiol:disulfide interchange protein DsbC